MLLKFSGSDCLVPIKVFEAQALPSEQSPSVTQTSNFRPVRCVCRVVGEGGGGGGDAQRYSITQT